MAKRRKMDWDKSFAKMDEVENKKAKFKQEFENLYSPKVREDGTKSLIIRFLEPPIDETLPYVKRYHHMWQDANGWFVSNCPTSINGNPCPVCKENGRIWDDNEKLARKRGRKLNYYANIMVINDPDDEENNGKVFLFKYGIKIHEKIMAKVKPQDPLDEKLNIFSYEDGANSKLKIKRQTIKIYVKDVTVPNYDASEWSESTPIINTKTQEPMTDNELDDLDKKLTPLEPIIGKEKFKSYDELAVMFTKKTGIVVPTSPEGSVAPQSQASPASDSTVAKELVEDVSPSPDLEDDDDEDEDAFLESLRK